MNRNEFIVEVQKLNIEVTDEKLDKLDKYYQLLVEWNTKINLTRIILEEEVYLKHFYDSLTLSKAIDLKNTINVCDIGTGAGFPGIILKIFFPKIKLVLVDSLGKRIMFLNTVIQQLNLKDVFVEYARGEEYILKNKEKFDLITCRALAKLTIISEICLPGVKLNGYFIPMKGNIEEETKNLSFLKKLGGNLESVISFELPKEQSVRNLIVIKKEKHSDFLYPREYSKIIKKPL